MSPRLLVVDDEPSIRTVVPLLLRSQGWEVEDAASGEAGLERCRSDRFDVVLLDQRMPGLSGIEVARLLRDEDYPALLVLFSAYLTPEVEREAEDLAVPTLTKSDVASLPECLARLRGQPPARGPRARDR
jgi:CheY-like chemotaxis protein